MEFLKLPLKKPLVFLKVHTTGVNFNMDRIVQITITKYHVDGTSKTGTRLINPEMPIPPEATKINGITNEMVNKKPTFYNIAQGLYNFIGDSDIAGFNVRFDISFLMEEFGRAMIDFNCFDRNIVDLKSIYHSLHPRDFNNAALQYTGAQFSKDEPIDSEMFTSTCVNILNSMIEHHGHSSSDIPGSVWESAENVSNHFSFGRNNLDVKGNLIKDESGNIIFTYGKKYPNRPLLEIVKNDPGYLNWLLNQSAMPRDTKSIISAFIKKVNTTPETT